MRAWLLAAPLIAAAACGDVAESSGDGGADDAAAAVDAESSADADPSCRRWRLEDVTVLSAVLLDATAVHPDRTARILIETARCPGDLTGPVSSAPTLENEFLSVRAQVWRASAGCDESEVVRRPVAVRFPYPGTWKIPTAGSELQVEVVGAPDVACGTSTGNCRLDCDCSAGEACLSGVGLGGPFAACARPCELDRDCLGDGVCASPDDGLAFVCESGIDECADPERPCPDGFDCAAGSCSPQFELNGSTRHACSCDAECGVGLRCAWQLGADAGRCEAVCRTNSDGWCQGPHSCSVTVEAVEGVCGWVGD